MLERISGASLMSGKTKNCVFVYFRNSIFFSYQQIGNLA